MQALGTGRQNPWSLRDSVRTRATTRLLVLSLLLVACKRKPDSDPQPPEPVVPAPSGSVDTATPPPPALDAGSRADAQAATPTLVLPFEAQAPTTDWPGPFLTVTVSSAGIYSKPVLQRPLKLGFARNGGRLPVKPDKLPGEDCPSGWFEVVGGGFVCSRAGTTNSDSRQARLTTTQPDLSATLPYPYARNAKNGTPLYRSVPTQAQMKQYEPYLSPTAGQPDAAVPWWQRDDARMQAVDLKRLEEEADAVLERRMVKGFYVAVDREFSWSDRNWYKTTKGMVGPKDRFWSVEGSEFEGVKLTEDVVLPIGWTYGYSKTRPQYEWDEQTGKMKASGEVKRLTAHAMTQEERIVGKKTYALTTEGHWLRKAHIRIAQLPPIPDDIRPDERWIDVNLDSQTLVAFVGSQPVYTTLVSSGKESDNKKRDHRTPTGMWTIREKHVTTTMDGDGSAAGDLPYSIEDVPYAMYFHGSYALHGAFWHRNYGSRMSHGCVNLAPLDARYLFFFSEPQIHAGWHGAWASEDTPGTRIVIRDPTP